MAFQRDGYWYDNQIKRYCLQFMAIFSGIQVQVGKWGTESEQLITVPIKWGSPDKVVASILADNTQNKPLRLPMMSAYVKGGLNIALDKMHGTGTERRNSYVPMGGLVPNDIEVVYQRMPIIYDMDMELSIYASNNEQRFQILEQILPLFDPQLNIQTSDAILDHSRLTSVRLTGGPTFDDAYPVGSSSRLIQSTLNFQIPIYLNIPAVVRKNAIEKIFLRVGAVSQASGTDEQIIAELDSYGIQYDLVVDESDTVI